VFVVFNNLVYSVDRLSYLVIGEQGLSELARGLARLGKDERMRSSLLELAAYGKTVGAFNVGHITFGGGGE